MYVQNRMHCIMTIMKRIIKTIHANKAPRLSPKTGLLHDPIVSANFVNRGEVSSDMSLKCPNNDEQHINATGT